jgi:peptidyl-prolyl cis-trans isomerase SurA
MTILFLWGCAPSSPTLVTIGGEQYSLKDFDRDYKKNSLGEAGKSNPSREDVEKFLNLMIDYKLKIKEAEAQNMQKDSAVRKERDGYRASVAQTYAIEKEFVEPALKQFYERRKEILHVYHIYLPFPGLKFRGDTLGTYNQALKVIQELNTNTLSFDSAARKYSGDPNVKRNGGEFGYISAGRMFAAFEDACYGLQVGEYTKSPVQSSRGYHIIRLVSKRAHGGSLELAHLFMKLSPTGAYPDSAVLDSVRMICDSIKKGMTFEEAAARYSADKDSPQGKIGSFEEDNLVPFLIDSLEKVKTGGITNPIRFAYGYELIKVLSRKPMPSYAEMESHIKDQYQKTRYAYDFKNFVDQIRKKFPVKTDSAVAAKFVRSFDTNKTVTSEHWRDTLSAEFLGKTLFQRGTRMINIETVVEKMEEDQDFQKECLTPVFLKGALEKLADKYAMEDYAVSVIPRYPELEKLLAEYEDGILLDKIEQAEVWGKVPVSDSLLRGYYEQHKESYRWPSRVSFAEIFVPTDSAAKAMVKKIKKGQNFLELAEKNTTRAGFKEKKGLWGFMPLGTSPLSEKASKLPIDSVSAPFQYEGGWSIVKTIARDSAQIKSFEDVQSDVLGEYQNKAAEQRKVDWIKELRVKYPVVINQEILGEAVQKEQSAPR